MKWVIKVFSIVVILVGIYFGLYAAFMMPKLVDITNTYPSITVQSHGGKIGADIHNIVLGAGMIISMLAITTLGLYLWKREDIEKAQDPFSFYHNKSIQ